MKNNKIFSKTIGITLSILLFLVSSSTVLAEDSSVTTEPAITPDPVVVTVPTLRVSSAKSKQVTMKWNKISNASKYQIYQKVGKGKWKKLKTLSSSKTKYTKKKLNMKKTYSYKIRAKINSKWQKFSPIIKKVKVKGKYTQPSMSGSKLTDKELRKIRDKVANFVNKNQTWRLSQKEKAMLAMEYTADTISYRSWNSNKYYNTAYGGLVLKKGACSAYARSYKALADGMGLKCKCVHTNVSYNDHQFNHVKFNGSWWVIDPQVPTFLLGKVKKSDKKSMDMYDNYYIMKR